MPLASSRRDGNDHKQEAITSPEFADMASSNMKSILTSLDGSAGGPTSWPGGTVLSGWVLAITRAMEECGVQVAPILAQLGIDPALMANGFYRYEQTKVSRLWVRALSLCGTDGDFSLRVAAQMRPATFHVVGYAMNCSVNLFRALQRFSTYSQLISGLIDVRLNSEKSQVTVELDFGAGGRSSPAWQTVDTVLASIVAFLRLISGSAIQPTSVCMTRGPGISDNKLGNFFACPMTFGAAANSLVFSRQDLEQPLLSSDEELATLLNCVADRYMEKIARQSFTLRLRTVMKDLLASGDL